jgi:serine/threonine protein kinase
VSDVRQRLQSGLTDRYQLERELGRGGMATVFLATDLKHKRPVALKVLHPELAQTLGPERFQREIETAVRSRPRPACGSPPMESCETQVLPGRLQWIRIP